MVSINYKDMVCEFHYTIHQLQETLTHTEKGDDKGPKKIDQT